jgi:hypothetical protein
MYSFCSSHKIWINKGCETRLDLLRLLRLNLINMSFSNMVSTRFTKREEIIKNKTDYILDKIPTCTPDLFRLFLSLFQVLPLVESLELIGVARWMMDPYCV